MHRELLFLLLLFYTSFQLQGQNNSTSPTPSPLLLDRSALSGVGFEKIDRKDDPDLQIFIKRLYKGEKLNVRLFSSQTKENFYHDFYFDEFVYMFHGEAAIRPVEGSAQVFQSGDYFFAPRNFQGHWAIRAGNHFHYELSVVASKPADSTLVSSNLQHSLFPLHKLSGTQIKLNKAGHYEETLRRGLELTVKLKAERPQTRTLIEPSPEKLIQILTGMLELTDNQGQTHTFYTNDFVVIPEGFVGKWKSQGHGLLKYMEVTASD